MDVSRYTPYLVPANQLMSVSCPYVQRNVLVKGFCFVTESNIENVIR